MKLKFLLLSTLLLFASLVNAQETGTTKPAEKKEPTTVISYKPEVFGAVKAKFELSLYDGDHRFNVRNSRVGVRGNVSPNMKYAVQIDFNNEGKIAILDSYATYYRNGFEFSLGQQQYRFITELDRGPNTSFFANRSFLAKFLTTYYGMDNNQPYVKSIGSRDIGALARYKFNSIPLRLTLGGFNGAGTNNPEWSNSISIVSRVDVGNADDGLSGAISHYNGHTPAKYVLNYGCEGSEDGCAPLSLQQHLVMWGGELTYARKQYRIEAQYAQRRLNDTKLDVLHTGVVQGLYKFLLPKNNFAEYLSPLLRWDIGKDIEYYNAISKKVDDFSAQRVTVGLNLGFVSKIISSEFRINYEKYVFNNRPSDYNNNKLFHDKVTIEIIASF